MKKFLVFLMVAAVALGSCNKCKIEKNIPDCINSKTTDFCNNNPCETAKVEQYLFQGKPTFVMDPGTCGADQSAEVLDADCNTLGSLGGFAGNSKINGEEFSNATFVRTVWKQEEK